ncbi:MAG TPA: diguanylate cyclase [Methylophilaceae bacterium]|jgi:diguanylate cyclase (GGDEF)-like protein
MSYYQSWLNLPIRTKFIACLLVTSLSATGLVGAVAYGRLMQKFDSFVLERASSNFSQDVRAYFSVYGSWQEGNKHESFHNFAERRRRALGLPPPERLMMHGDSKPPILPPSANLQMRSLPAGLAPQQQDHLDAPPFRFYLFDKYYMSLMDIPPYRVGDIVSPKDNQRLLPITLDGRVVAYFVPDGKANYSEMDLGYLSAMREALLYGILFAVLLTLGLGFWFGSSLSRALRQLTVAAQAMRDGDLRQHIKVKSGDEVGLLANAFNRMSSELANQHEKLHQSHEQIQKQAEQMNELSRRDALTMLHNRRHFDDQGQHMFNQAARYQRPFSVMLGDIDYFKKINDNYSHAVGDEVLRKIGEILSGMVRNCDLVARYGGEEFVIAFPETPLQQAHSACETLRKRIEEYPWHTVHPELKVTMSMGISANGKAKGLHEMLKLADNLLYRAKNNGRNQVCMAEY